MGKKKAEQKAQQSDSYFQIWWNSSEQSAENKAKAAEHLGPGSRGGTDKSSKRGRKMKGFGLEGVCILLALVLIGVLVYLHISKKGENQIAQEQNLDTISVERVQIPAERRRQYQQKAAEKKVEAPVITPVKEKVKVEEPKPTPTKPTNSKIKELEEWLASHPEPQMPIGSTDREARNKYSKDYNEWVRKNSEYQGRLRGEIND